MSEIPPFLLVTIDTECDKTSTWHASAPLAFRAVLEAVPDLLQPVFAEFSIRPTYLLSPEVMTHPESCAVLRDARDVELGTHLHGDYLLPRMKTGTAAGARTSDMQCEYQPQLERAKLEVLTELFVQQFGRHPRSFRAGRFGVGHQTARFLRELGYVIESSVTPHIRWTDSQGKKRPDFRRSPGLPYRVGPKGDIWKPGRGDFLELPITILTAGELDGTSSQKPVWFRPSHSDSQTLIAMMDCVLAQPAEGGVRRPLVMMFHNVELVAAASPYAQTQQEVGRYLDSLKRVFEHAKKRGLGSCTMDEYHAFYLQGQGRSDDPKRAEAHRTGGVLDRFLRGGRRGRGR